MSGTVQADVYLVRHGETAWSISGQHTGLTDLHSPPGVRRQARALGPKLKEPRFDHVLSSPLQRALRTCELAGFGPGRRWIGNSWSGITVITRD